jgi:hypothetical protein
MALSSQQCNRQSVPGYREREQTINTERHVIARLDPVYREQENEQQRNRWSDPEYRACKQVADMERQAIACDDEEVRENENEQRCNRRARTTYDMACTYEDGKFHFCQPCGKWNIPCVHGCRYIHLLSSMPGTRKKCCENGRMSINSNNCNHFFCGSQVNRRNHIANSTSIGGPTLNLEWHNHI